MSSKQKRRMYIRTFKYNHLFLWLVSGVEWYGKLSLCVYAYTYQSISLSINLSIQVKYRIVCICMCEGI